jgi:hypothetical protein
MAEETKYESVFPKVEIPTSAALYIKFLHPSSAGVGGYYTRQRDNTWRGSELLLARMKWHLRQEEPPAHEGKPRVTEWGQP